MNFHLSPLSKLIFAALMAAACVLLSPMFSFPLGPVRAFPLQHMTNIFLAVLCGTKYSVAAAFVTSALRNMMGSGSILAFPGSMVGAFLAGWLYGKKERLYTAVIGEFIGTSLLGGLISYPIAVLFMGSDKGALFYVSLFAVSCGAGCVIAYVVMKGMGLVVCHSHTGQQNRRK
ncbi:MAG: energy coupling factor transporter S component ThiW [Dialister sp.]|nr:energy coupling factor transporter S component ThiW [Dialister sp.]